MKIVDMHCDTILKIYDDGGSLLENDFKESYRYLDKVIARLRKYLPKGGAVEIVTSWGRGFGLMVKKDSNES